MNMAKELKLNRLFDPESKRMVLITADHGMCINPMPELSNPAQIARWAVEGGADALLVTSGVARQVYRELLGSSTSLLLRLDGTATSIGPDLTNDGMIYSVEGAVRMGVDAVATFGVIGVPREAELSHKIGMVSTECDKWGMVHLCEVIPGEILLHHFKSRAERKWPNDPELIKYSARVAAELGGDVIKGFYTGDSKSFHEVIEYCPAPYVVLSGPAAGDLEVFLSFIKDAMDCGAAGVSVGRNVWAQPDPTAVVRALCRIVHEDATIAQAMKN